jgi:integrase
MTTILKKAINGFTNKKSREHYCRNIKAFLSWKNNTTYVDDDVIERDVELYMNTPQDYTQDLIEYIQYCINEKKYAPHTVQNHIKTIKHLLNEYEKSYNNGKIRKKTPEITNIVHDRIPDEEIIKKLVLNAKPLMKSLILFLTSGGMRIHELLAIEPQDITEKGEVGIIYLRKTKRRGVVQKPRTTLCTKECLHFYHEWMKIRDTYIRKSGSNHFSTYDKTNDKRVFPFNYTSVKKMLITTLKTSDLCSTHEGTNRQIIHFHIFRKYCDTKCLMSGMNDIIRHLLMGHSIKGMDAVYCNPSEEMLITEYKKAISKLTVLQDVEMVNERNLYKTEYEETRGDVKLLLKQMKDQEKRMKDQDMTITELTNRIKLFTQVQRELAKIVSEEKAWIANKVKTTDDLIDMSGKMVELFSKATIVDDGSDEISIEI